jgi:hypothetical protein
MVTSCANLHRLYCDPKKMYNDEQFKDFTNFIGYNNDMLLST